MYQRRPIQSKYYPSLLRLPDRQNENPSLVALLCVPHSEQTMINMRVCSGPEKIGYVGTAAACLMPSLYLTSTQKMASVKHVLVLEARQIFVSYRLMVHAPQHVRIEEVVEIA